MKSTSLLCYLFIFILLLSGCQPKQQNFSDACSLETDHQMDHPDVAETQKGYFFLKGTSYGAYLYYCDKQKIEPIPLCDKPNCLHSTEFQSEKWYDCNAYMGDAYRVFYNDGYIYILARGQADGTGTSGYYLRKLSAQGAFLENVYQFPAYPESIVLHRGSLFYSYSGYVSQDAGQTAGSHSLIQVVLNENIERVLYVSQLEGGGIAPIMTVGKRLFFNVNGYEDKSAEQAKTITKNYYLDLETETITQIQTRTGEAVMNKPVVLSNTMYYSYWYYDYFDERNQTIYKNNLEGTAEETVFTAPTTCDRLSWDREYFYFDNWPIVGLPDHKDEVRTIRVYDQDFHLVTSFDLSNIDGEDYSLSTQDALLNVTEDHLLLFVKNTSIENEQMILLYVNKAELKNGTVTVQKVPVY